MRRSFAVLLASALALPAMAASQRDSRDCDQTRDSDRRMAGCSRIIEDAKETAGTRSAAHNNRGIVWQDRNELDKAIADFNEAIRLDPKNDDAYTNRGNAYQDKREHDRAIADFDQAIRINPKSSAAYNGRGNAWQSKSDDDRAIADYNQAIRLDPKDANPYNGRGNSWANKKDHERAIADYSQAIRVNPQYAMAYSNRGDAWYVKGDYDRAIADYDQAIRLDPKYAAPYNGRSDVWRARSQPDRAIADALQAIRLEPDNGDYHGTLSSAYQEKQDFERALKAAADAIRLNPKSHISFGNRGTVWRELGELDKAIADYNEAIRLKPDYDKPYSNRGDIWRLQGDLNRALADHDQAVRLNANDPTNYVFRADTLRYKGEFARALTDYDSALRVQPGEISAYTGRGLTFEKMGDPAKARAEFEKALASKSQQRSDVNREALETARARLAALNSGAIQPVIPAAPGKAASATSIPTPAAVVPAAVLSAVKQGRRVALVIGNSAYRNVPALVNPQRDADAIAASLRAIGFDNVTLTKDSNRERLTTALRDFAGEAEKADWAVVYYAGHGMEVNGTNYLIPVEARIAADRDIQFEAVPLDQVMAAVDAAKKLKLVLLDACRDNPFASQMRKTAPDAVAVANRTAGGVIGTRSVSRGLGEVRVSGATLVVYAAKHGQVALDGEGGNSPFAVAVVQRLATPNVEINKLFRLVRDDVMEATAGRQEPYTYGSLPGREDFFFVAGR